MAQRLKTVADLPGVIGYLTVTDTSTLTLDASNGVQAWAAQKGGLAATQTDSTKRPVYNPSVASIGNKPGLVFNASARMDFNTPAAFPTGSAAHTVLLLFRGTVQQGNVCVLTWGGSTGSWRIFGYGNSGTNLWAALANVGDHSSATSALNATILEVHTVTPGSSPTSIHYANGGAGNSRSFGGALVTNNATASIGYTPYLGLNANGVVLEAIAVFDRVLSTSDRQDLEGIVAWQHGQQALLASGHPYQSAAPTIDDGTGGAAGVSGSAATTLAAVTAASAAVLAIAGAAAVALAPISGIATGTVPITAQASSTLGGVSAAGAGGLAVSGSAAAALGQVASASAGSLPLTGQAATQIGSITTAAFATLPVTGSSAATLGQITTASAARADITGMGSTSLAPVVGSGTGGSGQLTAGRATAVLAPVTSTAAGTLPLSAAASAPLASITAAGAGQLAARGQAAATLGAITAVAVGSAPRAAIAAAQLAPVSSAAVASLPIAGTATATLGQVTIVATAAGDPNRPGGPAVILPQHRFVVPARQRSFTVPRRPRAFLIRKGTCMSSITKYPAEERQYQADWTPDLAGQTIAGNPVASSSDPTLIVNQISMAGAVMKYWLRGGTPGRPATIRFVAATSGGEDLVFEQTVIVY